MVVLSGVVMPTVTGHMVTVVCAQTQKVPHLGSQEGVPECLIYSVVSPRYTQSVSGFT